MGPEIAQQGVETRSVVEQARDYVEKDNADKLAWVEKELKRIRREGTAKESYLFALEANRIISFNFGEREEGNDALYDEYRVRLRLYEDGSFKLWRKCDLRPSHEIDTDVRRSKEEKGGHGES